MTARVPASRPAPALKLAEPVPQMIVVERGAKSVLRFAGCATARSRSASRSGASMAPSSGGDKFRGQSEPFEPAGDVE